MRPGTLVEQERYGGTNAVAQAAWHSLAWLVIANAIGTLLAILLLFPGCNALLGEWTYGRWMMVHMDLELYGWTSLPLAGYLFHVYGAGRGLTAQWCRPVLWLWSAALSVGALSWLSGHSSGKLFLDWTGYARMLFVSALLALWLLLFAAFIDQWKNLDRTATAAGAARFLGLVILVFVPLVFYMASEAGSYPPINPSTGGPTGASQLESSLAVVLILLLLPLGIAQKKLSRLRAIATAWMLLVVHAIFCAALGRADASHHEPLQYLALGSMAVWLFAVPLYYRAFAWRAEARLWRAAVLLWWSVLVVTGTLMFVPGVLDFFKFTDALVGHSFVAMAGFTSSLIVLVMVQLLGKGAWIFSRSRSFILWHGAVAAYAAIMTVAGWREGADPAFTIVPGLARNLLYALRLVTGVAMLLASIDWLSDATRLVRQPKAVVEASALETTA